MQNVVALTGDVLSEEEQEQLRKDCGFVAYYAKPLSKAVFAQIARCFGLVQIK